MKRHFVIVLACVVLTCGGVLVAQRRSPGSAPGASVVAWEHAVFRIGGNYQYEWQGPDKRVYGTTLTIFFERMALYPILARLHSLRDDTQSSLEYVGEAELMNHLGAQGWELVAIADRGPAGIANKTFWLKRPKPAAR